MRQYTKHHRSSFLALLTGLLLLLSIGSLTACNTVEGAGKDIENTGDAIQDAAD